MEYVPLITSIRDGLSDDPRIVGIWLTGSRGRGDNDEFSDADFLVATDNDDDLSSLGHDVVEMVKNVVPVLHHQQLGTAQVFTFITDEWLRFDISMCETAELSRYRRSACQLVYGSDDIDALLGEATHDIGADAATVERLTIEFMRVLGLLPVVIGRDDVATGLMGASLVRNLLIELMKQDAVVADRGGALSTRRVLSEQHYGAILTLPPLHSDSGSVVAYHITCAQLFFPLARMLYGQCGLTWPERMHTALGEHLRTRLGIQLG